MIIFDYEIQIKVKNLKTRILDEALKEQGPYLYRIPLIRAYKKLYPNISTIEAGKTIDNLFSFNETGLLK